MAASSNRGSNMFRKSSLTKSRQQYVKGPKNPELLPPSSFETTSRQPGDNWKEMAQVTAEILQLTQENIRLRESRQEKTAAVKEAAVDARQVVPPAPLLDVRHLDDIIRQQAIEIAGLRGQLTDSETHAQRQVSLLESQLMLGDAHSTQQVAALEGKIRTLEETRLQLIADKTRELNEIEEKWTVKLQGLHNTMDSSEQAHNENVSQLKEKLGTAETLITQIQEETAARLRQYDEELRTRNETISQLKRYLGESEQVSKSTEIWRKETEFLKNNLQHCEAKRREMESSAQLMSIRLASLNEIFIIHEKEISGPMGKERVIDKKRTLLTRWRTKVYQLLVQLKSAELTQESSDRDWQTKLGNVENELESSMNQCEVLRHTLSDRQAQIDLQSTHDNTMQHELRLAQETAIELDDRNKLQRQSVNQLVDTVQCVHEKYCSTAKQQQGVLATLSAFSQRIAFASGRMEMLRSQFARREAILRLQSTESATVPAEVPPSEMGEFICEPVDQLRNELDQVTAERDKLVAQVKADADQLEAIVASVHLQAADEIAELKKKVKELEVKGEESHKRTVSVSEDLRNVKAEADEARDTAECLKADIARKDMQAEKDVESVKSTMQAEYVEQLAELERRLNNARREHTKAVVAQRQTERQAARERDRATERVQGLEEHHGHQVATLEKKLKSMEKDRNLLMATLRQEGLIGKYKSQRAAPVGLSNDEPLICEDGSGDQRRTKDEPPGQAGEKEPLESVINDLKSLTAAIIEETSMTET